MADGTDYKVRVTKAGTFLTGDISNAVFTVDNTDPALSTNIAITSNNSNPLLAKLGNEVTVTMDVESSSSVLTGTIDGKAATGTVVGTTGTLKRTLDGSETAAALAFSFVQTDAAGNATAAQTAVAGTGVGTSVTADFTAPVISALADGGATVQNAGDEVTITFNVVETGGVTAPVVVVTQSTDDPIGSPADTGRTGTGTEGDPYIYTYTYTVPAGDYTATKVKVDISDSTGNAATQSVLNPAFNIDNTAPSISAGADAGDKYVTFTHVDPTATDANGIATYGWTKFAGTGTITFSSDATLNPGNISVTAGAYDDYTARLTVVDVAGNSATDDFTFSWLPAVGLVITDWSPASNATGVAIADGTATITFNSNITLLSGGAAKVTLVDNDTEASKKGTVVVSSGNGNSAILNIPYTGLANNTTYRINIAQGAVKDASNNVNTATVSYFTTVALGDSTAPAGLAITTADATVNADYYTIAGTITADANDVTIQVLNGSTVVGTVIVTAGQTAWSVAVALPQSTATTFTARATDPTGNPALSTSNGTAGLQSAVITESTTAGQGTGSLVVTSIDTVQSYATANATYASGFIWDIHVTVPTDELALSLKLSDFISATDSIPAENARYCSEQSSDFDCGSDIEASTDYEYLTDANIYTDGPITISAASDLDTATAGVQALIRVMMKVPAGTDGGSYSGSYGVQSESTEA